MTSLGHIYMIWTPLDNSFCYIGSTFNRLHKRLEGHKNAYNNKNRTISIHKYFDKYGIDNFKIDLIKSYNVIRTHKKDHKHLEAYETLWINNTKNCVNEKLPFMPLRKEHQKQYREDNRETIAEKQKQYKLNNKEKIVEYNNKNKEKIAEKQKQYRENNKGKAKEYNKQYNKNNKEKIKEKYKEYREQNKQKIKEKKKEYYLNNKQKFKEYKEQKFDCECGGKYTIYHKARHLKTNKHIEYLKKY